MLLRLIAESAGLPTDEVVRALLPVLRDLVDRGFLVPAELPADRGAS